MKRPLSLVTLFVLVAGVLAAGIPAAVADHARFADGDVFVAVGENQVQWRHPDGSLNKTLTTAFVSPQMAGLGFDPSDRLYVAGFTANAVSRFAANGAADGTYGSPYVAHPTTIAFDGAGNGFVGLFQGTRDVRKLSPAGDQLASFDVQTEATKGVTGLDLAGDCALLYVTGSQPVRRFDVCGGGQGPALTSDVPGSAAQDVAALPDGGALVAGTESVVRLGADGSVVGAFDKAGHDCWTAVALDPVVGELWAADECLSQVVKFDSSGAELASFGTGTSAGSIGGLAVNGTGWSEDPGESGPVTTCAGDVTTEDDTCGTLILPDGTRGGTLEEDPNGIAVCQSNPSGAPCFGADAITVVPPDGYKDATNPVRFLLYYDVSVQATGLALIETVVNGVPATVPALPCGLLGPTEEIPCLAGFTTESDGDTVYEFHLLTDPKFQGIPLP